MKIAILTDKSRKDFLPSEEAIQEDNQKKETVASLKKVLSKKYDCISLTNDEYLIDNLKKENVDLVFNLCNGLVGESKLAQVPALLESINMPYTASSVLGHALASSKLYSAKLFEANNIPTPKFIPIYKNTNLEKLDINYPVIIKPNDEGSSRGIHQDSLVFNLEELKSKVKKDLSLYNEPILLNEYISGREFSIGVIGNTSDIDILPIQEVDLSGLPGDLLKFYSFEIKTYYKEYTKYYIPPTLTEFEYNTIKNASIDAFNALDLKDYARVDIILKDNIPYVLEINSLPGLMENKSALYRMSEACELGYDNFIFKIIETTLKRYNM